MHINESARHHVNTYQKHRTEYPMLNQSANPLVIPQSEILGRDHEMKELLLGLRNPEKANVILLGEPGSGKSALVQGIAYGPGSDPYLTLSVNVEQLIAENSVDKDSDMSKGLLALVEEVKSYSQQHNVIVRLFMDEFHRIAMLSPTSVEALKPILEHSAEEGFRIIAATTFEEYDQWIAGNRALDQRMLPMRLDELQRQAVIRILKKRAERHHVDHLADPDIYAQIYDTSKQLLAGNSQPRASVDILTNMIGNMTKSEHMVNGELVREYATVEELNINADHPLSRPLLNRVIQRSYGIDIDNKVNIQMIRDRLTSNIYDQEQAIEAVLSRLEMSLVGFNDPTRPKVSFLSTGQTGVGKALRNDEMIPTPSGFVRNGDLSIGDKVFLRNGNITRVDGVFPQGEQTIYRMYFRDGRTMDSADSHRWTVKDVRSQEESVISTADILSDLNQGHLYAVPRPQAIEYSEKDMSTDAYTYGVIRGQELTQEGIPNIFRTGSIRQRESFLQGLSDSIASFDTTLGILSYSINGQFQLDVLEIMWSLGLLPTFNNERIRLSTHEPTRYLSSNSDLYTAAQTYESLHRFETPPEPYLMIDRVERLEEKVEMTCIRVAHQTHEYVAGRQYVVTHNTELAKEISDVLRIPLKRFDMSRYPRPEDAVHFADELANAAWSAPNAYILIDEAEKSTRECMNILLQVLDDARLTAANNANRVISFAGNIINLTTNLGSEVYEHSQRFGEKDAVVDTELIYKSLSDSPQFETAVLGRIDVIVPFKTLPLRALAKVAQRELQYNLSIAETALRPIFVSPDIIPYVVIDRTNMDGERGGARGAKRNMKNIVIQKLAAYLSQAEEEVPVIIRLDALPRFRDQRTPDPLAADVVVEPCYPMALVDAKLQELSRAVGYPLVNEGLFIPQSHHLKDYLKQIVLLSKKGHREFKTTIDITNTVVIPASQDVDIAGSMKRVQ